MSKTIQILTSLPADTKPWGGRRADAKPVHWDYLLAVKGGEFWWSRGVLCPCRGNDQTDQPDPTCTECHGTGYTYMMPDPMASDGDVDVAGHAIRINEARTAIVVQAWIGSITYDTQIFERFGKWVFGTGMLTTARFNRIGYRDKFEAINQEMNFSQLIQSSGLSEIKICGHRSTRGLWTKVSKVNILRTKERIYRPEDYRVTPEGTIEWLTTPPGTGVVVSVHAAYHPAWIVLDFTYGARDTLVSKKTLATTVATQYTQLPQRSVVKLDFLVDD